MDPELPPEHSLVAAVKALNVELVNEILDTHKIDLNALSAAALAHRPHRAGHPMSLSGGILHSITSMDALSITPMDVLGAAVIDHAMLSNARAIFEKLLECGASPACTDWDGFTPLHWACTCAVDWAILALIRAGAPVNATSRDGDTPLHCLFKRRPGRLGGDAVQRLVAPLLDAGADPTARRGDGLRPFDMLFRFSHCGPAAVQAERDGLLTECRPSNIVAGKLAIPGVGWAPVGSSLFRCQSPRPDRGDRRFGRAVLERHTPAGSEATNSSDEQLDRRSDRWPEAAVAELREKAHELDARRRSFVRGIRTLLLWRCREARRGPGGSPVHLLPEEVLFQVVLLACEDSGVRDDWRRCFAEIGEQASVQTTYSHRLRALSAWTTASSDVDEEKRELLLQQLSGQYDEARAALARLRRAGDKAEWAARPHARALRAVQEFVAAARPVLHGCGEDGE